jgi:hypothetical protein
MGQTAISCTDRKLPGSLPELRLTRHVSFLVLVRRVFVVDVNVLCVFVLAVLPDHVESRLVICLKMERVEVVTDISELAE